MMPRPYSRSRDWQAPPEAPPPLPSRVAGIVLLALAAAGAIAWLGIPLSGENADRKAVTTQVEQTEAAEKAPFLDRRSSASTISSRLDALFSVNGDVLTLRAWDGDKALVAMPIPNSWAIICNEAGLRVSIPGVANEHLFADDRNGGADLGSADGLTVSSASYTPAECAALVPMVTRDVRARFTR